MKKINRKKFIQVASLAAGLLLAPHIFAKLPPASKIKAVVFDAFRDFDPRPLFKKVNELGDLIHFY